MRQPRVRASVGGRMEVIFEALHGSRAYGLATETSDVDKKGVFVPGPRAFLGFLPTPEQVEPEPERVLYDVRKFFRLAAACNPTLIEVLFTDAADRLACTPEGELLLQHRDRFLSRMAAGSFGRYALSQLKRIKTHRRWLLQPPPHKPTRAEFGLPERTVIPKDQQGAVEAMLQDGRLRDADLTTNFLEVLERERRYRGAMNDWQQFQTWQKQRNPRRAELERDFGYDTKHAMHLVRLLRMAKEILAEGRVQVRRQDADELRAIRAGAWSYDALVAHAEELGAEVDAAATKSPLPEEPDVDALNALCAEIAQSVHARVGEGR